MSSSAASFPEHLVVTRLRAAGCVFAEDEARLLRSAAQSPAELEGLVASRVAGEPLEYILGWVDFCGLRVPVDEGVFVPRQRTGLLVAEAAALTGPGAVVLDLCCGSGAIGVALAYAVGPVELYAADSEPAAVRCARRNVEAIGGHVYEGDLFEPLPAHLRGRADTLVANVPYVPSDAIAMMPPEARDHEPRLTLDGGTDGLDIVRRVAAEGGSWLSPGGHILIEINARQAMAATRAFADGGLEARVAESNDRSACVVVAGPRP
ncbi:MAG: putative protein N(5)-glutamine methyltransferase [Nocardioidaceae bacterium]